MIKVQVQALVCAALISSGLYVSFIIFMYSFQIEPDTSFDSLEELHFQWLPKPYQIKIKVQQLHITCTCT